ncbi:MAG: hypothetical protein IPM24_14555 [Bryobacterales bacterium]|nr:hypothetical protein [Bryobacterales bacterium]
MHKRSGGMIPALAIMAGILFPGVVSADVHKQFSPFWTSLEDCQTTIRLHNNLLTESLTVKGVLYLRNGTPLELNPITMPPKGSASIPVNELVVNLGYKEPQFGGAEFSYDREHGGALGVETEVIMAERRVAYSVESFAPNPGRSRQQHAVFWLPTRQSEIFVAVHNTSDEPVRVLPEITAGRNSAALPAIDLAPRGFASFRLPGANDGGLFAPLAAQRPGVIGGITLRHRGAAGAVVATGWIDDRAIGYSNMMTFTDPGLVAGQELYGTQILTGQWPGRRPGRDNAVRSMLLVKNMSDIPVTAAAEISYGAGSAVSVTPVAMGTMAPGAVGHIDLALLQTRGVLPRDVTEISVRLRHSGQSGALMARAIGISNDGDYGFYSALEHFAGPSRSEVHWTTEGQRNSLVTVANFGPPDNVKVTLSSNLGPLPLDAFRLETGESRTLDLRAELAAKGIPAGSGGYSVKAVRGQGQLVVKEHIVDQATGFAIPFYGSYDYVVQLLIDPSSAATIDVDQSINVTILRKWSDFSQDQAHGAWTEESPTGIVSVTGSYATKTITGSTAGSTTIGAESWEIVNQFGAWGYVQASPQKPVTVKCLVGVDSVDAHNVGSSSGTARVKIRNTSCSGSVHVRFTLTDVIGNFVPNWGGGPNANQIEVFLPADGTTTSWQTKGFSYSGSGGFKVHAYIELCNGGDCTAANFTLNPSSLTSGLVEAP